MNILQSKINQVTARIKQITDSDLFSNTEKEHLIKINQKELDALEMTRAKEMVVNNSEII